MKEIDGSYCEGGGQILRTAVALSGITKEETRVYKIREGRDPPGLKPQHLSAVRAAGAICNAKITGAEIGSKEILFSPGDITPGGYTVDIGTAGSITLLLQTLIPIAAFADDTVILRVRGGTNVRWSPSIEYFSEIFLYFLDKIGIGTELELKRHGFYPKGGGKIKLKIFPWRKKEQINCTERGRKEKIQTISIATPSLKDARVAERQAYSFRRVLPCRKEILYVDSYSTGSSITGLAYFENSRMGSCSMGERGKRAEIVGKEAAEILKRDIHSGAALDGHMGDQIIPYLGFVGGRITVPAITTHLKTNCRVVEQFLPVWFHIERDTVEAQVQRSPTKIFK